MRAIVKDADELFIVPCKNSVGEWEINNTHETFDTYVEAEKHLLKLKKKENEK